MEFAMVMYGMIGGVGITFAVLALVTLATKNRRIMEREKRDGEIVGRMSAQLAHKNKHIEYWASQAIKKEELKKEVSRLNSLVETQKTVLLFADKNIIDLQKEIEDLREALNLTRAERDGYIQKYRLAKKEV